MWPLSTLYPYVLSANYQKPACGRRRGVRQFLLQEVAHAGCRGDILARKSAARRPRWSQVGLSWFAKQQRPLPKASFYGAEKACPVAPAKHYFAIFNNNINRFSKHEFSRVSGQGTV